MRQILFLSGKGGTGKTTVAGAFAALWQDKVLADCDVDAANLHLLLNVEEQSSGTYEGSSLAVVDPDRCTGCGRCLKACRFHAISRPIRVDPFLCEGCGTCVTVCPEGAATLEPRTSGRWLVGASRFGPVVTAELVPGEEASGKLVSLVKRTASELAQGISVERMVVDGSPGIGCPVIASTTGVDLAILVTEPSLSGLHDLERVLAVVRHFRIDAQLVLNKHDLSDAMTDRIEAFAGTSGLPILGRIPFDPAVSKAMVRGQSPVEVAGSPAGDALQGIFERFLEHERKQAAGESRSWTGVR